jgi:hypothetical protein
MSEPVAAPATPSHKLSELIYVELIGRAFLRVNDVASIKPDPVALAKLSIELASVFDKVEHQATADSRPKNVGYDIQVGDIGSWNK